MKKTLVIVVNASLIAACQTPPAKNHHTIATSPTMYQSRIAADGTSVVVKLADGQQRVIMADEPHYSAKIGQITVQDGAHHFAIQATQPTLSTEGKVTGSVFKPNAPEGAHWQLVALNGQHIDTTQCKRPPYLRMSAGKMQGLTGCNVMSGVYRRDSSKHTMQFMQVQGGTQPCDMTHIEKAFVLALQQLRVWQVTPDYHLQFLDGNNQVLAEFVALSP